jgi:hypothetical protein
MPVGSLYSAEASFPGPLGSIQHSHRCADTRLTRFQEVRPLSLTVWGQTPLTGEYTEPDPNRVPFPVRFCSTALHHFMYYATLCVQQHHPRPVYGYLFGNGVDPLKLRKRYGLDTPG